jgi:hypothetical protein
MNTYLNADLAEMGADAGMLIAASHADRELNNWSFSAKQLFEMYATLHPDGFMTEEVRVWAEKLGFETPPDNRAWGYIAKAMAKHGVVVASGFAKQRSSTCHGSPKTVWKLNRTSS